LRRLRGLVILRAGSRAARAVAGKVEGKVAMVMTVSPRGPVMSDENERPALADAEALLRGREGTIFVADARGSRAELPESAARLVHRVLRALANGNPVEVNVLPRELTIQHAAEILDLRPQDVVQLLDEGEIPFVEVDDLRRIRFEDVMAYKPTRDADRRAALAELTRLGQEMGGYDLDDEEARRTRVHEVAEP
jgi:excisionase family DNA binding protein